jgi:hypothetical protein
MGASSPFFTT